MNYDPHDTGHYHHPNNPNGFHANNRRRNLVLRRWEADNDWNLSNGPAATLIGFILVFIFLYNVGSAIFGQHLSNILLNIVFDVGVWAFIISAFVKFLRRRRNS